MCKYALVYHQGRKIYLGLYGSSESKAAYTRLLAELQKNPTVIPLSGENRKVTVSELAAEFLDYAKVSINSTDYMHYQTVVLDFLEKLYGDNFPVDDFKPRCLKLVREKMITDRRFCRHTINKYVRFTVSIFAFGVEHDLVLETTWRALKVVKSLPKGYPGTFDHEERKPVPDSVIRATLQFMPPTLQAMVIVQRLTGMRPSEVCKMRVGDIKKTCDPELWHYVLESHKTEAYIGSKSIPLGTPEQKLITPYLEGKKPTDAVFSPRTAQEERNAEKRANRKTKIPPSQVVRNEERAAKPPRYGAFYSVFSYRQAIEYAIAKGNKVLPEDQKLPHWFCYQLRHTAGTETSKTAGKDRAKALLAHRSIRTTEIYDHSDLEVREELARNRQNPFESEPDLS